MARDLSIILSDKEDIISYEYHVVNKTIRVLVGVGTIDIEGNFIPTPDQTYKSYFITDEDLVTLLASKVGKPANTFRKDDLWGHIDKVDTTLSAEIAASVKSKKV